jgi:hypothetical protein
MTTEHNAVKKVKIASLEKYLPEGMVPLLEPLLQDYSLIIRIKQSRKTKFGDYRPLRAARHDHQITLNNDLNPYAFLVTLVHEIAHMHTYARYKNKVRPHGTEWQNCYSRLLLPFTQQGILPEDITHSLRNHLEGPTASSCTDHHLYQALRKYDEKKEENGLIALENLPQGEHFRWRNGQVYRKDEKLRKRFRCIEAKTKRVWYFHPMAEVERLDF